ncbi:MULTISPECIES: hypothetical protein [Pseudomonas]|jgi:hypothetical protein|uniref:hypothetical protein n=1 Tax=Pseudomonas TaxID=286 RepID=UPI000876312D|nr:MULTISPECIES: hypothetical protein [Pseudomonas]QIA05147.1 hypothetical protein GZH78_24280 [Pseudomonas fluorescens]TFA82473.1 hypothetical protein F638_4778 [Pseudomonas sp. LAIL14HWK12:I2]SCZ21110.1 hypothetical protein SAMN03159313_1015 [Pseudomonas sp. NFIX46]SDB56671.1 hypothetical protein SAMN03097715_04385 [Pseudomonas putida]SFQ59078.1 hypothetical protein SAMN03159312_0861 [Pseudomonas sp. NFIX49]
MSRSFEDSAVHMYHPQVSESAAIRRVTLTVSQAQVYRIRLLRASRPAADL